MLIASLMGNTRGDRINSKAERTSRKFKLGEIPEKPGRLISASELGALWARGHEAVRGWGGRATVTGHPSPGDLVLRDAWRAVFLSLSQPTCPAAWMHVSPVLGSSVMQTCPNPDF